MCCEEVKEMVKRLERHSASSEQCRGGGAEVDMKGENMW